MSLKESNAPGFTPGLLSTMDVVAGAPELQIIEVIEVSIKTPTHRRAVLHCRMPSGCLRHVMRRERCSHRRRPSSAESPARRRINGTGGKNADDV
jgi:hypothetical protein